MTVDEWGQICDEVESLFGRSTKWTPKTQKRVFQKFAHATSYDAAMSAVQDAFLTRAAHAPSPSEIITSARERGGVTQMTRGACRHPNLVLYVFREDGTASEGMCAACRVEFRWPASKQVRTVGDIEELQRAALETVDVMT